MIKRQILKASEWPEKSKHETSTIEWISSWSLELSWWKQHDYLPVMLDGSFQLWNSMKSMILWCWRYKWSGREDSGILNLCLSPIHPPPTLQMRKQRFRKSFSSHSAIWFSWHPDTDAWSEGEDLSFLGPLPVSEFMGNCESQGESRVFIDVTTPVRLAHSWQVGQPQSLTTVIDTCTEVFSESKEQGCGGASRNI